MVRCILVLDTFFLIVGPQMESSEMYKQDLIYIS